jgi:outer membrane protein OmpA-like peptidoglycan-associated protein
MSIEIIPNWRTVSRPQRSAFALLALVLWAFAGMGLAQAAKPDPDYERLRASLIRLSNDRVLGPLAPAEISLADQALAALAEFGGKDKLHDHLVFIAQQRVEIAYATAEAVNQERKLQQLDREHDQILLAASRRDAEQARLELEKQRIQSLAQAEEADRLRAEADEARAQSEQTSQEAETARKQAAQARKLADAQAREAELARKEAALLGGAAAPAAAASAAKPAAAPIILGDTAFAAGKSTLTAAAQAQIAKIVAAAGAKQSIHVEAHADDAGSAKANLALSQQRAAAIRDALIAAGVSAKRISAVGGGAKAGASRHAVVSFAGG